LICRVYTGSLVYSLVALNHIKKTLTMHQNSPFSDKKISVEVKVDLGLRERPCFFSGPLYLHSGFYWS